MAENRKINFTFLWRSLSVFFIICVCLSFYFKDAVNVLDKKTNTTSEPISEKYPAVSIIESQAKDIKRTFKSYATLQGWKEVTLKPPYQSTIRQVLVRVGDSVDVRQTLTLTGSEIQKLKADLEKIDFELRNLDFSVTLALAKKNFLSSKELRQRELEHKASIIRAKLNTLESAERLQSPIKGVIAELSYKEGDFIDNNSTAAIKIIDASKLKVPMYVPQEIIPLLKINQDVQLTRSGTSLPISATLASISPTVDARTGSVFVEVVINKVPVSLLPGMFVQVEFTLESAPQAIVIPTQAIVYEAGQAYVYKIGNSLERGPASTDDSRELFTVAKVPVKVGLKEGDLTQIAEGLEELDQVVTQGLGSLSNGATVEVIR